MAYNDNLPTVQYLIQWVSQGGLTLYTRVSGRSPAEARRTFREMPTVHKLHRIEAVWALVQSRRDK